MCPPQDKGDSSQAVASNGCCLDFTHPCKVPPYPLEEELEDAVRRGYDFSYKDYGPGGLFWPYGGSGTFVSAGLAIDVVGSAKGWGHCARAFGHFNTDIQVRDRPRLLCGIERATFWVHRFRPLRAVRPPSVSCSTIPLLC